LVRIELVLDATPERVDLAVVRVEEVQSEEY
jgi:hypothetical protein